MSTTIIIITIIRTQQEFESGRGIIKRGTIVTISGFLCVDDDDDDSNVLPNFLFFLI